MQTLQDFIRTTKGWEYIIAIGAVFLFIVVWEIVSNSASTKKGSGKRG